MTKGLAQFMERNREERMKDTWLNWFNEWKIQRVKLIYNSEANVFANKSLTNSVKKLTS